MASKQRKPEGSLKGCLLLRKDKCLLLRQDRYMLLGQGICLVSQDISSRVVQEAPVCSQSIKLPFLELIPEHNRRRPALTGAVLGYVFKHPQTDPPHPYAKARMTAVKQSPSNQTVS